MKIPNHHTLLHVLPNLAMISYDLLEDIREGESIETLTKRFNVLVNNIDEINDQSQKIAYLPECVKPLMPMLFALAEFAKISAAELKKAKYGGAVILIANANMKIYEVVQCAKSIGQYELDCANQEASQAAMYAC